MIDKYVTLNRILRAIASATREMIEAERYDENGYSVGVLTDVISRSLSDLKALWPTELDNTAIYDAGAALGKGKAHDISGVYLPLLEDALDDYFLHQPSADLGYVVLDLLHPRVTAASYAHFKAGRFRDAVLNSVVAVFDLLRDRTGIDGDGADLLGRALSLDRPRLIFSTLETESGRNEQKGFIQILQGYYAGIRNPKAHSLAIETDQFSAAQYLVLSSLLCRKIEEARKPESLTNRCT
jgi:uncharacterized protein (TIGR02391 family)